MNSAPRADAKNRLERPRSEDGTTHRHSDAATRTFPHQLNPFAAADIGNGPRPLTIGDDPSTSTACSGPTATKCCTACENCGTANSLPRDAAATLLPRATANR